MRESLRILLIVFGNKSKVGLKIYFKEFLNLFRVNFRAKEGSSEGIVTG
jgi:hypothetical protein